MLSKTHWIPSFPHHSRDHYQRAAIPIFLVQTLPLLVLSSSFYVHRINSEGEREKEFSRGRYFQRGGVRRHGRNSFFVYYNEPLRRDSFSLTLVTLKCPTSDRLQGGGLLDRFIRSLFSAIWAFFGHRRLTFVLIITL